MPAERVSLRALRAAVDTDLVGTFNLTHAVVQDVIQSGAVLNVDGGLGIA